MITVKNSDSFKVGIVSFILVCMIGTLLLWKSNILLRTSGYEVIGHFENISGLLAGAEVRYRGYKVGRVVSITPEPGVVEARFYVGQSVNIPEGSLLKVDFDGLIGEKFIQIMPNTESEVMISSGTVLTGFANSGISDFVEIGAQNLKETKAILASLRKVITSDDVTNAMTNAFLSLEKITENLADITELVESAGFQDILTDVNSIVSTLKDASDTVFVDGELASNLAQFAENISSLTQRLEDKNIIDKIDRTVDNLAGFSETINVKNSLGFDTSADLLFQQKQSAGFYNANFDITYDNKFVRLGFGNQLGKNELLNVQQGIHLSDDLVTRIGLFYNEPGIGFDYQLFGPVGLSLEAFNFTSPEFTVSNTYAITDKVDLLIRLLKDPVTGTHDNLGFGLRLNP